MGLAGYLLFGLGIIIGAGVAWRFLRRARATHLDVSEAMRLRDAEKILTETGYRVLDRQRREMVAVKMWGKRSAEPVVIDLMVEKDGKRHPVVVDTGEVSEAGTHKPDIRCRILEAQVAFPRQLVLLVRTHTGEVTGVEYASIHPEKIQPIQMIGFLAGALAVLLFIIFFFLR